MSEIKRITMEEVLEEIALTKSRLERAISSRDLAQAEANEQAKNLRILCVRELEIQALLGHKENETTAQEEAEKLIADLSAARYEVNRLERELEKFLIDCKYIGKLLGKE